MRGVFRLRGSAVGWSACFALALAAILSAGPAHAQFTWGGGAGPTSPIYEDPANWAPGGPPVLPGSDALFDATGDSTVTVTTQINPDGWTFGLNAQVYNIAGSNFAFAGYGIVGNSTNDVTIANDIGGVGGVSQSGAGILALIGNNTFTGNTAVGPGGVLHVGGSSALGTGSVTLDAGTLGAFGAATVANSIAVLDVNGPSVIDSNGNALTLAGNIIGPGVLMFQDFLGGGTTTLTGNINVGGGIVICSCSTVQIGTTGIQATIAGNILNDGGILDIVNANTAGLLSITNTFFGQTSFLNNTNAGTASIVNDTGITYFGVPFGVDTASAASATITNINGGIAFFLASSAAGNATIVNDGSGSSTIFDDNASAGSASITNLFDGQLQFFKSSTAGNARIFNEAGGSIIARDNTTLGNAVIVNNSDGFPATPAGIWLIDNSSAGSAAITNNSGGFIWFGQPFGIDTSTAGNASITNNAGSELVFNAFSTAGNATIVTNSGAATYFYDNATGGNARFVTSGTGFVDFTSTLGLAGDGRVTAGSIEGSGIYFIGVGNTLTVGSNGLSTELSGILVDFNPCQCVTPGPGNFEKVGAGRLILSGANTYTGTTTVTAGVLEIGRAGSIASNVTVNGGAFIVNGNVAGSVTVGSGAVFGGDGSVGSTVLSGGTLSPGNSIGTITINGNLVLAAAVTYFVELDPSGADRTNVTGTASVAGTVQAYFAVGAYSNRRYTILSAAGGVTGTFGAIDTINLPAGFVASLTYDPNNVYLSLSAVLGNVGGLNQNQRNVATSLNTFFNAGGLLSARFVEVFRLTGSSLLNALTQLSGEIATQGSQAAFTSVDYFLNLMLDPFVTGRGGDTASGGGPGANQFSDAEAAAYAAKRRQRSVPEQDAYATMVRKAVARNNLFDPRWSLWGAAYGGALKTSGNAVVGSHDASVRAFGFAAGADYRISPDTLVGFAMSGGGTNFSLAQAGGSGRSDVFQAGAFVRHNIGQAYVKGAVAYGWHDVTTNRTVAIAGIDRLEGRYNANSLGARAEGGYRFVTPWMGVTPYAAAQAITYYLPGYGEQVALGLNTFALNYAGRDVTTARTELGLRTDRSFALQTALVTLRSRAAWAHYYDDNRSLSASFQTLPGASFTVTGAAQARDAALLSAAADVKWINGVSFAGVFEGEFSSRTSGYAGKGIVRYVW